MILTSGDAHTRDDPNLVSSDTQRLPSAALSLSRSHTVDPTNDRRTLDNEYHVMSHPSDTNGPPPATTVYYALPGNARRPLERYSLDDNNNHQNNGTATPLLNGSNFVDSKLFNDSFKSFGESLTQPPSSPPSGARDIPPSLYPATMRQSSYPLPDGAVTSRLSSANGLSSSRPYSPTLAIPISSTPRAYPQHPTYITPAAAAPDPINPILSPNPPQAQEEICVECAMRDQDMADVIVIGPGIWDRESDVLFEELLRREEEEETSGVLPSECSSRPRARGGRLTEQNLKLWTTMTPKEPTSRQQTVDAYVKAQRSLLEAEALAHARAMQESILLENSVRDTYTQLRRSVYDLSVVDDNAFKLKPPRATSTPNGIGAHHIRSTSRDITLLDNGLIVEHVDVRREEKEEKERRRRQERRERSRPRKSSRGSVVDVMSLYSSHSLAPHTDSGLGPTQSSRYSAVSMRPASSLTVPIEVQPSLGQVYSQASFSDAHSPGSVSPRRSRFFGFKNLSSAWRSQDSLAPSGMSGSMIDMQKKRNGLAKIWKLVKGGSSHRDETQSVPRDSLRSLDRNDDDSPLAPPPPLSYLVERGPGEHLGGAGGRHASTPSLPSTTSPRNGGFSSAGMSPSTAPTSLLPSPTSSRPSGGNGGDGNDRKNSGQTDEKEVKEVLDMCPDENGRLRMSIHPVTSEPDMRQKLQQATFTSAMTLPKSATSRPQVMLSREKSLPPLPGEVKLRAQHGVSGDPRPQTLYTTYDLRHLGQDIQDLTPPHAPFRDEARRQSFSGIGTRPNLGIQTMPPTGGHDRTRALANGMYSEFGVSRGSLGRLGDIEENPAIPSTPTKRKSKFGFAALLGKKSSTPLETNGYSSHEFPRLTSPIFDPNDDNLASAYTHSVSRLGPRLSVASRKAIEERVEQDREFVAYRYPSQTQPPIDLVRPHLIWFNSTANTLFWDNALPFQSTHTFVLALDYDIAASLRSFLNMFLGLVGTKFMVTPSAPRGLSAEEKRVKLLEIFHESLKELEKLGPKLKGIVSQSVKEVLQSLVDDGLVQSDKIGSSNFFWSFPSQRGSILRNRLDTVKDTKKNYENQVTELGAALDREKVLRPESVARTNALQNVVEARQQIAALEKELEAYGACDPVKVEEKKRAIMLAHEAAVRWTDNYSILLAYFTRQKGVDAQEIRRFLEIGEDYEDIY
ncbi:Mnd1 family-domain-containing protein [Lanmaoa asiatica]|nr:Mnd1 family-domain-containing protein [Lanmaoa asiatica]